MAYWTWLATSGNGHGACGERTGRIRTTGIPISHMTGVRTSLPGKRNSVVLRGGVFGGLHWGVRCAYRSRLSPLHRGGLIGFRVVVRPAS